MGKFSSTHLFTIIIPGSEIVGVPASETSDTISLFFIASIIFGVTFFSLNL